MGFRIARKSEYVAKGVEAVHRQEVSLFKYNDENSMACVISLAFYAARNDFHVHRERLRVGEQSSDKCRIEQYAKE